MYFKVTLMERGHRTTKVYEAPNKRAAAAKAKREFPRAVVVQTVETAAPIEEVFKKIGKDLQRYTKGKIKIDDKIATIRQIAVMTDAGIPIHDTLEDVAANTSNKRLREIYHNIAADINAGKSMSQAIKPYSEEFGHVAIAMTNLGEKTGNFPESYHKLADILENIRDNTAKFKKALRYPLITLTAMAIAFVILIMLVVPKFRAIFEEFHAELPVPTKILLSLEYAFSHYGPYILITLAVGIYALIFMYKNNNKFKFQMDKLMVHPKFYLINRVIFLSSMYNYTLVFGELVRAGIPVSEALQTAVNMVNNDYIREKLETVNANIGRGMSLTEAFEQTGLFENMLLQMIKAGEASGQLDKMLQKVTDYYNMRFQDIIDNLSSYIEPIMLFFIAGLVLLMALGIFLPMWDLGRAVKNAP
ncbi:type II secretion system F family protein [Nitratifractor salsuginis]|uniref:Type II secretion system F domain protein n=1 Tax=Nitratifractor salsuginis (strain DSM 16511 / JCM 12458 / E9I37-1) TaxID=749222 RepID=E6X1X9_NITSE|nr:type II secretion system F family protein [Nitratifractor salsuginis]ADV45987.1 Type II secretion system F domain protein [Nitratifractor salsuginis DSM 16511]